MYYLTNIIRVIKFRRLRLASDVARIEEQRRGFKIITGEPTGKRTIGKRRRRWEDNIRIVLEEIGVSMRNWIDLSQDRDFLIALMIAALNFWVPEASR